jgi:hypothetical protein
MANSRSWSIILALQAQLQTIRQADGYLTDIGSNVWRNEGQRPSEDALGLMIYSDGITGGGLDRERPGKPVREFSVYLEAAIADGLDDAQERIHAVLEDIEVCMERYAQRYPLLARGVTQFFLADAAFLDRPDGAAVVAMQARIVARYFR